MLAARPQVRPGKTDNPPLMFRREGRDPAVCVGSSTVTTDLKCVYVSFGPCVCLTVFMQGCVCMCVCQTRPPGSGSAVAKQLTLLSDRLTDFHKLIWLWGRWHATLMKLFTCCQWKRYCSGSDDDDGDDEEAYKTQCTHNDSECVGVGEMMDTTPYWQGKNREISPEDAQVCYVIGTSVTTPNKAAWLVLTYLPSRWHLWIWNVTNKPSHSE